MTPWMPSDMDRNVLFNSTISELLPTTRACFRFGASSGSSPSSRILLRKGCLDSNWGSHRCLLSQHRIHNFAFPLKSHMHFRLLQKHILHSWLSKSESDPTLMAGPLPNALGTFSRLQATSDAIWCAVKVDDNTPLMDQGTTTFNEEGLCASSILR